MEINVVQVELIVKYSIYLEDTDGFVYGVDTARKIFVNQIGKSNIEMVGLICLNNTNRIVNYSNIAIGTIENVMVPIAQIFKIALLSNSNQFIVAHNHPSGKLEITNADIDMTKKIGIIAKLFDMRLIDSLVVNQYGEVISIRENMKEIQSEFDKI